MIDRSRVPAIDPVEAHRRLDQEAAYLLGNGWTDVHNVTGGIIAWRRAGLKARRGPLEPGEGDLPG